MNLTTLSRKLTTRLLIAWSLPVAVSFVQLVFRIEFEEFPGALFYPAIIFASFIGGFWGGTGATVIAACLIWYFFLPPYDSLDIMYPADPFRSAVFVMVGITVSAAHQLWRNSQERYHSLFDQAGDGIVRVAADGRLLDANARFAAMLGRPLPEIIGTQIEDVFGKLAPEPAQAPFAHTAEGRTTFEQSVCGSGGAELIVEVTVTQLTNGDRLAVVHDITRRRQLEESVRSSEQRRRWAMDAAQEGMWDINVATGEVIANDQFFGLFGYAPGEMPGTFDLWSSSLHPDNAADVYRVLSDTLEGRRPDYRNEYRVVTKAGEVRWQRSAGKVVEWGESGQPLRIVGTSADITERKAAEQLLRDSEERFRLVVQNAPDPIVIFGENAEIRYVSPSLRTLFGISAERLAEITAALQAYTAQLANVELTPDQALQVESFPPAARSVWLKQLQAIRYCAQHPEQIVQLESRVADTAGVFQDLQVIYQGFHSNSTGTEVVCVIHDITEHRSLARLLQETNGQLEEQVAARTAELQAAVQELRRANAGKDAFLAAISHELRTPLMGVLSMSELLQAEARGPLNLDQARYVATIAESGQRLLATLNNVLLFTSVMADSVPLRHEHCLVAALCSAAMSSVAKKAAAKQQHVTQTVEPADLEIETDHEGMVNVIKMLLDNAVKFTPEGGRIDLSAVCLPEAGAVRFTVADTGIGMTAEEIDGLFEAFSQADKTLARRFEGVGIGLAYAHKMVELLGGAIAVESEPGRGSRFTVTLPAQAPASDDGEPASAGSSNARPSAPSPACR